MKMSVLKFLPSRALSGTGQASAQPGECHFWKLLSVFSAIFHSTNSILNIRGELLLGERVTVL